MKCHRLLILAVAIIFSHSKFNQLSGAGSAVNIQFKVLVYTAKASGCFVISCIVSATANSFSALIRCILCEKKKKKKTGDRKNILILLVPAPVSKSVTACPAIASYK